jgi:hypothetical protein
MAGFTSVPSKGQGENERKKPIRTNLKYYNSLWGVKKPAFPLATQEFRFNVLRPDRGDKPPITSLVESCEWRDEGTLDNLNAIPVLRGTMQLRKPHPDDPIKPVKIHDGHVVRCQVNWGGRWKELWRMRIITESISISDGAWSFEMADDLQLISRSTYDFEYVAGKDSRKKGWRYHEIVRHVCKDCKIPLDRKMPKGDRWIKDFNEQDISPLEAIRQVVLMEEEWTGRKHVIFWRDGKLHVKRLRRNPLLFTLDDQLRAGSINRSRKAEIFTAVTGTASGPTKADEDDGGGGGGGDEEEDGGGDEDDNENEDDGKEREEETEKYEVTVVNKKAVAKYGYIHKTLKLGSAIESRRELKQLVNEKIRKSVETVEVMEGFSHYGIAFVRRGDAIRVRLPEEGVEGLDGFLFVTTVAHSLSAGDYTMTLDLTTVENDPLDPNELAEAKERAKKHRQNAKDEEEKKDEPEDDEDEEAEDD